MGIAVVTGAAGFIGSHMVTRLLTAGYDVRMIDDLSAGQKENIDAAIAEAAASAEAPAPGATTFHALDIADPTNGDELTAIARRADLIFHFAALADIVPSIQEPLRYHRSNVEGTVRLLEAIRAAGGVKKLVYAASSSCYGIPEVYPTPETAPIRPQYPYALTKRVAEQYALHWSSVYGVPAVSLRFFNVYGPRSRTAGTYGAVFGVFLAQKRAGKPLTIVGDGTQTRDFIYVTDVVEACYRAAESDITAEVYNVAGGNPQSVNRLCELIGGPTTHVPKRPGEPDCTWADIAKIRAALDWTPTVHFEDGVSRMMERIEAWREAPVWTPGTIADATADWFRYLGEATPSHA